MGLFAWLTDSSFIDYTLTTVTVVGSGAIALLYTFQTRIIYLPQFPPGARSQLWKPSQFGFHKRHDDHVMLKTSDGISIHGYWLSDSDLSTETLPTFIYFQGNAGNIGHRLPMLSRLHETVPCNTFIISYRGFGLSEGQPNEAGIRIDAQAALDYVLSREDVRKDRIILLGQSIGGAVAFDLAARNQSKIYAVILENTFLSLPKLIPHVMPFLGWAHRLCHQKWDSETRLNEIVAASKQGCSMPHFLFLAGLMDELIPPSHMKTLYELATSANASTVVYVPSKRGNHVDTCVQPEYFPAIGDFMQKISQ